MMPNDRGGTGTLTVGVRCPFKPRGAAARPHVECKMGEIVNLRRKRKAAKRREEAVRAAENRLVHGRSKAERALEEARAEKARSELDAHRLETEDGR